MDPKLERARARLEQEYLAGDISTDEYTRRRHALHQGILDGDETGPELASWSRRAAAILLDFLLFVGLVYTTIVVFTALDRNVDTIVAFELFPTPLLYGWLLTTLWGQTLGKRVLGIRVLTASDGDRVGYGRAALRVVLMWIFGVFVLPLVVAWLWPLWDERNQTWYDKLVGTVVVRV